MLSIKKIRGVVYIYMFLKLMSLKNQIKKIKLCGLLYIIIFEFFKFFYEGRKYFLNFRGVWFGIRL